MSQLDWVIIAVYLLGVVGIGVTGRICAQEEW